VAKTVGYSPRTYSSSSFPTSCGSCGSTSLPRNRQTRATALMVSAPGTVARPTGWGGTGCLRPDCGGDGGGALRLALCRRGHGGDDDPADEAEQEPEPEPLGATPLAVADRVSDQATDEHPEEQKYNDFQSDPLMDSQARR
jgi:hypothetical protein